MRLKDSVKRHLVCTIVAPNYLDQFLVLSTSLALAMPTTEVRVLLLQDCADSKQFQAAIDANLRRLDSEARHVAVTIDQCDWGDFDVESAALFYNILEFATSVKPALLRSFLADGWDRVTYLDPDIQVFEDFAPLLDDTTDLSLTPHFLSDIPRDDFRPSTNDVLMSGFYNLGFCSVRPSAAAFLDWWSARLQFDCLEDHLAGYFTDQKIVDLAPQKANVQVLTVPGCNVAYWNLHERRIVKDSSGWHVAYDDSSHPLYFFHFSGFLLKGTPSLSKHANRKILGDAVPRSFANQYEAQLRPPTDDDDESDDQGIEFTLGGATLARSIPAIWRQQIRQDAEVHVRAGYTLRQIRETIYCPERPEEWSVCISCWREHDNFGTRTQSFLAGWATHPSLVGVPNAISAFFRNRHHEYRSIAMEQLSWASDHLYDDVKGVNRLLAEVLSTASQAVRDAVNLKLIGYFSYPAGIGQIARWTLKTLDEAGMHPAIDRVFAVTDSSEYLSNLLRRKNPVGAANASVLCFVNADQWDLHVIAARRVNPKVEHVEAVWAWELEQIPNQMLVIASSGDLERVHALSNWGAQAMAKVLPIPVQRFSPFDLGLVDDLKLHAARSEGEPTNRYVLATFDAKSFLSRKNPEGVLKLWQRVQADYPEHSLVLKSTDLRDLATPRLLDLIDTSERTVLIDEHLTDEQYFDLLANCAAFVSLHRSEGMGLTPIEAALCGLPVVYTNYGGVTDFLEEGFFPVSYSLAQVGDSHRGSGPYSKMAWWAEPDLDDAERQLRLALASSPGDDSLSSLTVDRKRLQENLITAQAEVVATAVRLLAHSREQHRSDETALVERLIAPVVEDGPPPDPHPVVYAFVNVIYQFYKIAPRRFRRQCNLAIVKLRGVAPAVAPHDPEE